MMPDTSRRPGGGFDPSQKLVLGFLVVAVGIIVGIRVIRPTSLQEIWATTSDRTDVLLLVLVLFILLLAWGVLRGWRWTFWLVLIAFAFGPVRVAQAVGQLAGLLPTDLPRWYLSLQAILGVAQAAISIALILTYRRSGSWGKAGAR